MKLAILALGLWLAGAQGFAAQACCADMPSPKTACDGCGNQATSDTSPRPDCCTSLEAQEDVEAAFPRNDLPERPAIAFLTEDTSFSPWPADTRDTVVRQASALAEGPPLYLRYEVLLI